MPEEKQTITGEIAQIVPWKTGKGYFLTFKDDSNDYYSFGKPTLGEGQVATFEISEGTGSFADKVKLDKLLKKPTTADLINKKAWAEVNEMKQVIDKGDKVYFDKQNLIIKQTCIKASSPITAALIRAGIIKGIKAAKETDIDIADRKYCYVTDQEGPEPEEPEEP